MSVQRVTIIIEPTLSTDTSIGVSSSVRRPPHTYGRCLSPITPTGRTVRSIAPRTRRRSTRTIPGSGSALCTPWLFGSPPRLTHHRLFIFTLTTTAISETTTRLSGKASLSRGTLRRNAGPMPGGKTAQNQLFLRLIRLLQLSLYPAHLLITEIAALSGHHAC